ncbi:glutathione hydrolase 1 proenzyme-like [Clytia hemisphaerica]
MRSIQNAILIGVLSLFLYVYCKVNTEPKVAKAGYSNAKRDDKEDPEINKDYYKAREFNKYAVAADNVICSRMGKDILRQGGNAADAIVTTHCCTEIINSHSTGLGGGGFLLYYDKDTNKATSYNFREVLPEKYVEGINKTAGETVLVPGVLRGLEAVHQDYGKLEWKELWKPCINLAEKGFRIHHALEMAIAHKAMFIHRNLGLKELYAPDGFKLKKGDLLKRTKLAKTYRLIADKGAKEFYEGEMAKQIVADLKQHGGKMSLEDLKKYQVIKEETPIHIKLKGMDMYSTSAPSSGAWLALCLKVIENLDMTAKKYKKNPTRIYHQFVEAFKYSYAAASYLSDTKFNKNANKIEQWMLKPETAKEIAQRIDDHSYQVEHYQPYSKAFLEDKKGTTHMGALDAHGSAVSLTSSINAYFGSKIRSRVLGFMYNNELADFSEFWPQLYNLTRDEKIPGKRPISRSMPTIFVKNKEVQGVFGAAGGAFIPTAMSTVLSNWLFFNDNLKVAITRPRIHSQLFPPTVLYEKTLPPEIVTSLTKNFGHVSITNDTYDVSGQPDAILGVVQAIVRTPAGKLAAECDYRKGGAPDGA